MQNLYRLANIIGLDTTNAQHTVALEEAMFGIEEVEAFLEYVRDKKEAIEYATKTEKLDTLATMYKKLQANAKLPHETAQSFSKQLTKKIGMIKTIAKNKLEIGDEVDLSKFKGGGDSLFSVKEVSAIKELGRMEAILEMHDMHRLEDELMKLFLGKYVAKSKYEALSSNQQRVKRIVGGVG